MRATIHLSAYLRGFADGQKTVTVDFAATTRDALEAIRALHPGVTARVLDEAGRTRPHINVFVGNDNVKDIGGLDAPIAADCEISLIPSVSGG